MTPGEDRSTPGVITQFHYMENRQTRRRMPISMKSRQLKEQAVGRAVEPNSILGYQRFRKVVDEYGLVLVLEEKQIERENISNS